MKTHLDYTYFSAPLKANTKQKQIFIKHTPEAFHTQGAWALLMCAQVSGLLEWGVKDLGERNYKFGLRPSPTGPFKTQTHLAYWCACASTFLGMDRGPTRNTTKKNTFWKPFEELFGLPRKTFSRAAGPLDLYHDESGWPNGREEYAAATNAFFNSLESYPTFTDYLEDFLNPPAPGSYADDENPPEL